MRMKQKGIKHIDISSTWGFISMEMAALCTPRQSFVRHITSQRVSFQDSKSNGALCCANFPYMAHVWSAAHPAAVLPPPPISLSPLHPNQEHFLLSVQSFMAASGGANGTLKQELRREVKILFAEELQNVVKLGYLCVSKIWYHPDVLLLLLHSPEGLFLSQTHAAVLRKC